jgi:cation:H+ antiporter
VPAWVVPAFVGGAAVSLFASARLVSALQRIGAGFGFPEVLLGLLAALAADSPELTSALAAELTGKRGIGVGVMFGSNVFNLAALLGLSALVAGRVPLHRRVIVLEGFSALGVAGCAVALVHGDLGGVAAASVTLAVFVPYVAFSLWPSRVPLPGVCRRWLARAVKEEREELSQAQPVTTTVAGRAELSMVGLSLVAVIAASGVMERAASQAGSALRLPQAIVGGVVLAAVTSLPNAVAAVQLARSGKGPAVLSEAMNSNTINVVGGLVLPAAAGGLALGASGAAGSFAGASYVAMTLLALGIAYRSRGVGRRGAAALIGAYGAFLAGMVLVS